MGELIDIILDLINYFVDVILDLVCMPLLSNPGYRQGFITASIVTLIIGWLSRLFLAARGKITVFFAEVPPSLKSSPSPYKRMNGCLVGAATIALLAGISFIVFMFLTIALTR